MAHIPPEILRDIADRAGIVNIVSQHVTLRRRGGSLVGLCPFHNEKSPSFHVNPKRQRYHCFGCGEHGDVFSFVMRLEGGSFREVVEELAERVGVQLPTRELSPHERAQADRRSRLLHLMEIACAFYERALKGAAGESARAHLAERHLPDELIQKARLGAAPEQPGALSRVALREGYREADLVAVGLSRPGGGERFRNRLLFPIRNQRGKVVGFGGRALDDHPAKYLNSPENELYTKSRVLYGMYEARAAIQRHERVVVVEGYFDRLALAAAGIEETVATCGTALTDQQLSLLRRLTRQVILLFDADEAGQRAATRVAGLFLDQQLWPLVAQVPDGKDPDDYLRSHGGEALKAVLADARPLLDLVLERTLEEHRGHPLFAERVLAAVGPVLARLDPVNLQVYTGRLSSILSLPSQLVLERIGAARRRQRPDDNTPAPPPTPRRRYPAAEIGVFALALAHPAESLDIIKQWHAPALMRTELLADALADAIEQYDNQGIVDPGSILRRIGDPDLGRRVSEFLVNIDTTSSEQHLAAQLAQQLQRLRRSYLLRTLEELKLELRACGNDFQQVREILPRQQQINAELARLNLLIAGQAEPAGS